jgi:hypothetical protein
MRRQGLDREPQMSILLAGNSRVDDFNLAVQ